MSINNVKRVLLKPHTHAGVELSAGQTIICSPATAEYLEKHEIAAVPQGAAKRKPRTKK